MDKLPKLEEPAGYIYLLRDSEFSGAVKVGRTRDPDGRMATFGTTLPFDTELIHLESVLDAKETELTLHRNYAHKRRKPNREWFALVEADIQDIVRFLSSLERPSVVDLDTAATDDDSLIRYPGLKWIRDYVRDWRASNAATGLPLTESDKLRCAYRVWLWLIEKNPGSAHVFMELAFFGVMEELLLFPGIGKRLDGLSGLSFNELLEIAGWERVPPVDGLVGMLYFVLANTPAK